MADDGDPKPATCDCRLGMAPGGSHTRILNCFDSYIVRSPLPRALVEGSRLDFFVGGQWGSENAWVAELRGAGVNVYSPPCGLFRLAHQHCSQARPNQLRRIDGTMKGRHGRRQRRERPDAAVCYAPVCGSTCERPFLPFADPITELCRNMANCAELRATGLDSFGGAAKVCGNESFPQTPVLREPRPWCPMLALIDAPYVPVRALVQRELMRRHQAMALVGTQEAAIQVMQQSVFRAIKG